MGRRFGLRVTSCSKVRRNPPATPNPSSTGGARSGSSNWESDLPEGGWRLFNARGDYQGAYDIVVIATAAHQVGELCRSVPEIGKQAEKVDMTVCWAGMLSFEQRLNIPYDAAFVLDSVGCFEDEQRLLRRGREHPASPGVVDDLLVVGGRVVGENRQREAILPVGLGVAGTRCAAVRSRTLRSPTACRCR